MVFIDVIGLLGTICLIGIRYPQYVILAALIHTIGTVVFGVVFHSQIEYVVAAGAFSTAFLNKGNLGAISHLFLFSGTIANYITMALLGGIEKEKTIHLLNPISALKSPFAVVSMRMAVLSFLFNLWNIFYGV